MRRTKKFVEGNRIAGIHGQFFADNDCLYAWLANKHLAWDNKTKTWKKTHRSVPSPRKKQSMNNITLHYICFGVKETHRFTITITPGQDQQLPEPLCPHCKARANLQYPTRAINALLAALKAETVNQSA